MSIAQRGVDSSKRPILATDFMWNWWLDVCDRLGFEPVITQGAWMSRVPGGGAAGSAGFHDGGGCFDLRTWNLTAAGLDKTIRVLRQQGAAAWRRDEQHGGFDDPHIHFVLGTDQGLSSGARAQWAAYVNGRDGLAGNGKDYEWRPDPLVLRPPEDDLNADDKKWLENLIDAKLAAQRKSIVADLLAASVTKAGDSVKKALRLAAGLGRGADE